MRKKWKTIISVTVRLFSEFFFNSWIISSHCANHLPKGTDISACYFHVMCFILKTTYVARTKYFSWFPLVQHLPTPSQGPPLSHRKSRKTHTCYLYKTLHCHYIVKTVECWCEIPDFGWSHLVVCTYIFSINVVLDIFWQRI